jgi:hypothetical protein
MAIGLSVGRTSSSTFLAIVDTLLIGPPGLLTSGRLSCSPSMTVIDKCDQITKGVWWMPWHREAMKDAVACEKLRGSGKQESIRRYLNEETQPV